MKKYQKVIGVILAVVFLATGCNPVQPVKDQGTDSNKTEQTNQQPINAPTAENKDAEVKSVENGIKYNGQEGKTALEILKSKYTVETKSFGSAGEFVESINRIKPDANHFWKFFINGKPASVGAGSYVTRNEDVLEWKLDAIQ